VKQIRIKIGDIIEIPLSDGRKAFAQYVFSDQKIGPLIQVFDLMTEREIQIDELKDAGALFPPVSTGLRAAIRTGMWNIIGHIPVEGFIHPRFISTLYNEKTGKAGVWFMWDGEKSVRIGNELLPALKNLEYLAVWDPHDIVYRIESREYPYPYGDLIRNNSFIPRTHMPVTTQPNAPPSAKADV
jgi:hypothetical protein